jgi:O-antigen ligase
MTHILSTLACIAMITGLFYLDRDKDESTSKALWIPVLWLWIIASRPVSAWFSSAPATSLVDQYSDGSPVDAAIYGVLILGAILTLNIRAKQVTAFLRDNAPLLLFFAYCALSVLWADSPIISLKRWVKSIGDFAMILVVLTDPNPMLATRRIFARVAFILLPVSVLLIYAFPNLGSTYIETDKITMYVGVTTFKNLLGVTCMFCGLGSLWSFLGNWRDRAQPHCMRHLAAHALVLLLSVSLIIKADSMTSLSCFAIAGAVMVISTSRIIGNRPRYVLALAMGAIAFAIFAVFLDSAGTLVSSLGRNATLTGRTQIWTAVLAQPINPILGTGFESFWLGDRLQSVWSMSQVGIEEAHNGYLEMYLNLGWIGVALLATLIAVGFRSVLSLFRTDPDAGRLRLALLTSSLIYSFTEAGFRMMSPTWIAFLLAVTHVPQPVAQVENSPSSQHNPFSFRKRVKVLQ